jgi:hypothetical protein
MTDIVKGMATAYWTNWCGEVDVGEITVIDTEAMRAALLFLAANVSDEMAAASLAAFCNAPDETLVQDVRKRVIAAAIRAAAGGGE